MKKTMRTLLLCAAMIAPCAYAKGDLSAHGSAAMSAGSGLVVVGSMSAIAGSGQVVIKSIEAAGESTIVVLQRASDGVSATVRLSAQAARELGAAVGQAVQITAMSTGHMLVLSGKALAFIPNEVGTALLHQSRVK